jgi:preprotein translocase subunit SecE
MATIVKPDKSIDPDDDQDQDRADERGERTERESRVERVAPPVAPAGPDAGFFHIYKKGQGYWTRMGTAGAAALLIAGVCFFLYENLRVWSPYLATHRGALIGILVAIAAASALLVFWLMNKPSNADFLIATDSEMKKVNWTSRQELIGSTKIVILFVVIIALFLFLVDVIFGYFFYWIRVLETKPF